MEDILRHVVNNNCDRAIESIGYKKLMNTILTGFSIPDDLIIRLINDTEFKLHIMEDDFSDYDNEHDFLLRVINSCQNSHKLVEINKFIRILPYDGFYNFFETINTIMIEDDDYSMIKIINNCKYDLLKPKYKKCQQALKSLALIGIYRNLEVLLSRDCLPGNVDTIMYQQRNKKLLKHIVHTSWISGCIQLYGLITFANPILAKFLIKNAYSLNIGVSSDGEYGYYEFSAFYYLFKVINQSHKNIHMELLKPFTKIIDKRNLIEFQHRKLFDVISTVLSSKTIKRKMTLYKLINQLLQIITTKNMIKLILYFV